EILQNGLCNLQHHGLDNAFEACLDSCILSIFDSPNETGNCDIEESEATLLMALTETLDSVDDENLSPFDTLPDSEIFQSQKAHEHFLISDSAEDDATFSKHTQDLGTTSLDELDWCLPISLEKDGENMSVTLGDLVKHMHPYSMTLCLEGEDQLLAREGIVLEVVDGGEHGEPILAIPDLSFPFPLLSGDIADGEQGVPGSSLQSAEFKPDDIPAEVASSKDSVVKTDKPEIEGVTKQEKSFQKCQLNRKKKLKAKEAQPVDRRVLRSASSKKVVEEPIKASTEEQKKKKRVTFAPVLTELCKAEGSSAVKKPEAHATEGSPSSTSVTPTPTYITQASRECDLLIQDEITESKNLDVTKPILAAEPLEKEQGWAEVQSNEAKPKTLSLEQYRLLRQQKKLCSLEKTRDHSTKWPTLAEAPRELPLIPCLSVPSPRDPRCTAPTPVKKEPAPEIMTTWQPRGPAVPPTPEALLIPPASILSSSRKPAPPKSAPQSPSKPTHNSAPSPSIQLNPQKLPVLTCVSNNTINNKVSQTAKRIPAENAVCLPVASATGAPQSMHTARHAECLQDATSFGQVSIATPPEAPFRIQDIPGPEAETAMTTRDTTNIHISKDASIGPEEAVCLKKVAVHDVEAPVPESAKPSLLVRCARPAADSQHHVAPVAAQSFIASGPVQARIVKLAEQMRMASAPVPKTQSPVAKLVKSLAPEIGIEATDLASLLEQFEETQPKEEHTVSEVCGRVAAVGNSSTEEQAESKALKKAYSPDLGSTAGLTPPATPPHQMWKPLAPVALLGKPKKSEVPKLTPGKVITIEPRPLPASKLQNRAPTSSVTLGRTQPFSLDHDYCLLPKESPKNELSSRWSIKQQPSAIIKAAVLPSTNKTPQQSASKLPPTPATAGSLEKNPKPSHPLEPRSQCERKPLTTRTITLTPDASPDRLDSEGSLQDEGSGIHQRFQRYSERSPSPCCHKRGRSQRTYRKRVCSSSGSRSSSSGSSRSRSRSPSPSRKSPSHRSYYHYDSRDHNEDIRRRKEKAIEERRVVYVGRVHGGMTRKELRERFSFFGEIEECTVHFREHGDNYGFVTYYNKKNAFDAIENGGKLRQPNELPFDLCFGGRRQFCRTSYADLDSNRDFDPVTAKGRFDALDFDTLLKQAQRSLK
ncbi:hypothetical protein P4O66_013532, partial [Electrophorus voltai]